MSFFGDFTDGVMALILKDDMARLKEQVRALDRERARNARPPGLP